MRKRIATTLLILSLLFTASCVMFGERRVDISDVMPRETDVPGWTTARPHQSVSGDNIRIINPEYIKNGAVEYSDLVYRSVSDSDREVTIEIITFESSLEAFGMFSIERGFISEDKMETPFLYKTNKAVYTVKDSYYIKVRSTHEEESKILQDITSHITYRLSGDRESGSILPDYVNAIPGNIKHSDLIYYPSSPDFLEETSNFFVRQKRYAGKRQLVIFARAGSQHLSTNRYYKPIIKADRFTLQRTDPVNMLHREENDETTLIAVYRNWFIGISKAESLKEAETTVFSLLQNIDDFEAAGR